MEVTEGWGLSDWYDTEDARRDAQEIERQLRLADTLLRLDPDDVYGLSIRAYYEYLAMDFVAADRTYDRLLQLDGSAGAHWNNLALVYKRKGEIPDDDPVIKSFADFVELCERKERETGEPVTILASY